MRYADRPTAGGPEHGVRRRLCASAYSPARQVFRRASSGPVESAEQLPRLGCPRSRILPVASPPSGATRSQSCRSRIHNPDRDGPPQPQPSTTTVERSRYATSEPTNERASFARRASDNKSSRAVSETRCRPHHEPGVRRCAADRPGRPKIFPMSQVMDEARVRSHASTRSGSPRVSDCHAPVPGTRRRYS